MTQIRYFKWILYDYYKQYIYSNINTLKWRSCHYLICLTLQLRRHQERPRKTRYHVREYPVVNFLFVIDRKSWKNRSDSHVEDASRSFKIQNGDVSVGHIFNKKNASLWVQFTRLFNQVFELIEGGKGGEEGGGGPDPVLHMNFRKIVFYMSWV